MIQVRLRAVDNHVPTVSIPIHKDAMKNQKPRFFCENCNAEVKRDAKFCSKCGHFFASVRCPVCGKTGNASEFKNGCPQCGYAMGSGSVPQKQPAEQSYNKKPTEKDDRLPLWIYIMTITVLLIVIVSLILYL